MATVIEDTPANTHDALASIVGETRIAIDGVSDQSIFSPTWRCQMTMMKQLDCGSM